MEKVDKALLGRNRGFGLLIEGAKKVNGGLVGSRARTVGRKKSGLVFWTGEGKGRHLVAARKKNTKLTGAQVKSIKIHVHRVAHVVDR